MMATRFTVFGMNIPGLAVNGTHHSRGVKPQPIACAWASDRMNPLSDSHTLFCDRKCFNTLRKSRELNNTQIANRIRGHHFGFDQLLPGAELTHEPLFFDDQAALGIVEWEKGS